MADPVSVDPELAWLPYEPTSEQPWDHRRAAHLYRRAGFGASWDELERAVQDGPQATVERLMGPTIAMDSGMAEMDRLAETILASGDATQLAAWWVYVMLVSLDPLLEKMTLFWHGHFATSAAKIKDAQAMYQQNRLLRTHAMGRFPELVQAISRDPAMLTYLDSATNRKGAPNENYARELMELFCLGEGNYSEQDVQELARCFTGWEIRRGRFRFNALQHDAGQKTLLGTTSDFPDGTAINVVLEHAAGPNFIAAKLVRYFILEDPPANAELIAPLAADLRQSDWDIARLVRRILNSRLFFSDGVIGRRIRSPADLLIGLLRSLEATTNSGLVAEEMSRLGQALFYPPNVKGWEGGKAWINSSTLLGRANAVYRIVHDKRTRFGKMDLAEYFEHTGAASSSDIVQRLYQLLLAAVPPETVRRKLEQTLNQQVGSTHQRIAAAIHLISTLPEFQLC